MVWLGIYILGAIISAGGVLGYEYYKNNSTLGESLVMSITFGLISWVGVIALIVKESS